ncbi:hypothetical protein ACH5RR_023291 [Cinchona calisaya]|uniref:Uncharacterized protein n=1 Tax=Cinchona calisaya TaxID=153742 RepID=A0ABD2ZA93_9GENT
MQIIVANSTEALESLCDEFWKVANVHLARSEKVEKLKLKDALVSFRFGAISIHYDSTLLRADWLSFCTEVIPRQLCYVVARLVLQLLRRACYPFVLEQGISTEEVESAYEDLTSRTILLLQKAVEELSAKNEQLMKENMILNVKLRAVEVKGNTSTSYMSWIFGITSESCLS